MTFVFVHKGAAGQPGDAGVPGGPGAKGLQGPTVGIHLAASCIPECFTCCKTSCNMMVKQPENSHENSRSVWSVERPSPPSTGLSRWSTWQTEAAVHKL